MNEYLLSLLLRRRRNVDTATVWEIKRCQAGAQFACDLRLAVSHFEQALWWQNYIPMRL